MQLLFYIIFFRTSRDPGYKCELPAKCRQSADIWNLFVVYFVHVLSQLEQLCGITEFIVIVSNDLEEMI